MLNFIPMPHSILIEKSSQLDEWGIPKADNVEPVKVTARISYNSTNEEIAIASGQMVRYTAQILIEGLPDLDYGDFVIWTDALNRENRKNPIEIDFKHDLSGIPYAIKVTV